MSDQPLIISSYQEGKHSIDLSQTISRLEKEATYKELSTVVVIPSHKGIPPRIVSTWLNLINPPNQRVCRLFAQGMEVGQAYSRTFEAVLSHPDLSKWKYILTLEIDNAPPPDGLLRLLSQMEDRPEFSAIGGLYFTKGEGGVAQIWGDPDSMPLNFRPQKPDLSGGLKECCGLGMGFTLFRMEMFKDERLRRPWFVTKAGMEGNFSQDLYFWEDARKYGYKCAVDCSCKVGHLDDAGVMW